MSDATRHWNGPIDLSSHDTAATLTREELHSLTVHLNSCSEASACDHVRRLADPMEAALDHIQYNGPKRRLLIRRLFAETLRLEISIWGWSDDAWIQFAERHRYDTNRIIAVAFLLCGFNKLDGFPKRRQVYSCLARRVFGFDRFESTVAETKDGLRGLGYRHRTLRTAPLTIAELLLSIRSPKLEDVTEQALIRLQERRTDIAVEKTVFALSRWLALKRVIPKPLPRPNQRRPLIHHDPDGLLQNVPAEWARVARFWHDTSTLSARCRLRNYYRLLSVGRWVNATHPDIDGPEQWTRTIAVEAVAMLTNQKSGEWAYLPQQRILNAGQPLAAHTKILAITTLRTFFRDLHEWEVIPRRFDAYTVFRAPGSLRALVGPDPRILPDDVWAKLIWAGLNITADDLSMQGGLSHYYPVPFVRAMSAVWLFAGLRWDEIRRLRVGCVRWQENGPDDRVCILSVPVNKTSTAFSKPVDKIVGEMIEAWEKKRPCQSLLTDSKTGERVHFLFSLRSRQPGYNYMNGVLIPALCKKAGIPDKDVRGRITSHRARCTIATQLFNAREPMSLFEVQAWLGHKHPASTQHYAKVNPAKLTRSYEKAGYFERNVRAIDVLIDQDVVRKGTSNGEPWKYFDLGHGFCTYDFSISVLTAWRVRGARFT